MTQCIHGRKVPTIKYNNLHIMPVPLVTQRRISWKESHTSYLVLIFLSYMLSSANGNMITELYEALVLPIALRNTLHMCTGLTLAVCLLSPLSLSAVEQCLLPLLKCVFIEAPSAPLVGSALTSGGSILELALSNMWAAASLFSEGLQPPTQPCH